MIYDAMVCYEILMYSYHFRPNRISDMCIKVTIQNTAQLDKAVMRYPHMKRFMKAKLTKSNHALLKYC